MPASREGHGDSQGIVDGVCHNDKAELARERAVVAVPGGWSVEGDAADVPLRETLVEVALGLAGTQQGPAVRDLDVAEKLVHGPGFRGVSDLPLTSVGKYSTYVSPSAGAPVKGRNSNKDSR